MKYSATYRLWLHAQSAAKEGNYAAIGAWTLLSVYAADRELGEGVEEDDEVPVGEARIPGCKGWSDRVWIGSANLDRDGVAAAVEAGLARWDGEDLLVAGYDLKGQRVVATNRRNGAKGGQPTKDAAGRKRAGKAPPKPVGNPPDNPPDNRPENPLREPSQEPPSETAAEPIGEPLTVPNLALPSLAAASPAQAREAAAPAAITGIPSCAVPPSPPLGLADSVVAAYIAVSGNTDVRADGCRTPQQDSGVLRILDWSGRDLPTVEAEFRRLKSDAWLLTQPFHIWASRFGTGKAVSKPAPKRQGPAIARADTDYELPEGFQL